MVTRYTRTAMQTRGRDHSTFPPGDGGYEGGREAFCCWGVLRFTPAGGWETSHSVQYEGARTGTGKGTGTRTIVPRPLARSACAFVCPKATTLAFLPYSFAATQRTQTTCNGSLDKLLLRIHALTYSSSYTLPPLLLLLLLRIMVTRHPRQPDVGTVRSPVTNNEARPSNVARPRSSGRRTLFFFVLLSWPPRPPAARRGVHDSSSLPAITAPAKVAESPAAALQVAGARACRPLRLRAAGRGSRPPTGVRACAWRSGVNEQRRRRRTAGGMTVSATST